MVNAKTFLEKRYVLTCLFKCDHVFGEHVQADGVELR